MEKTTIIRLENTVIESVHLERDVKVDFYLPTNVAKPTEMSLLLINDGQNLEEMELEARLEELYADNSLRPLLCVGIHAGEDRKMEYGTAGIPDFKGRGAKADLYTLFIFEELLPYIRTTYKMPSFREKAFAGFSLGGLSALDITWNYPHEFFKVGVFSGSLWWRSKSLDDDYDDADRIMHQIIRDGAYVPWLQFYFQTGTLDETMDRNKNGIIDSIDDTLDLIKELEAKGYNPDRDIAYVEMKDGKHDVPTWAKAFPEFLKWGWGTGYDDMAS
jgi:enterochelin esterase-like enzyme